MSKKNKAGQSGKKAGSIIDDPIENAAPQKSKEKQKKHKKQSRGK